MRVYQESFPLSGLYALMALLPVPSVALDPGFLVIAVISGVLLGVVDALLVLRGIDKKGEYKRSKAVLFIGLIMGAIFLWGIFARLFSGLSLSAVGSLYLLVPVMFATSAALSLIWENKKGMQVCSRGGFWRTFYSIKADAAQTRTPS